MTAHYARQGPVMGQMVQPAILAVSLARGKEQEQVARCACVLEPVRLGPQQSLWHTDTHKVRARDRIAIMDQHGGVWRARFVLIGSRLWRTNGIGMGSLECRMLSGLICDPADMCVPRVFNAPAIGIVKLRDQTAIGHSWCVAVTELACPTLRQQTFEAIQPLADKVLHPGDPLCIATFGHFDDVFSPLPDCTPDGFPSPPHRIAAARGPGPAGCPG